eukprot:scaffold247599_cov26-Tisochrysis_lutea.AAC.3
MSHLALASIARRSNHCPPQFYCDRTPSQFGRRQTLRDFCGQLVNKTFCLVLVCETDAPARLRAHRLSHRSRFPSTVVACIGKCAKSLSMLDANGSLHSFYIRHSQVATSLDARFLQLGSCGVPDPRERADWQWDQHLACLCESQS